MRNLNRLTFLVFIVASACLSAQAQTTCTQKIEIQNVKKTAEKGSFELKLRSSDLYDGQLIEISEKGESVVETFSGSGNLSQTFKNLKNSYYRVVLEFKNEPKFLCKRKILTIDLTDTPQ